MSERPEDVLKREFDNLPDVLMVGPPALDESFATFTAAVAQLVEERDDLNRTVAYLQGFWVPERVQELIARADRAETERDDLLAGFNATVDNWNAAEARADRAEAALRRISKMDPMEDVFDPEPFEVARSYFADTPEDELRPVKPGGDV